MYLEQPRWIVRGEKQDTQVNIPFGQMNDMLLAIMRLKALGYKVKTLPLTWRK